jgi:methionyl-tRNA formyltransferase
MGTPDFAVPSLAELIASGHEIVAVYSQPPRPKGRGQKLTPSPVHAFAEAMGLPVFTPESMKAQEAIDVFKSLDLDAACVVAYGQILKPEVLEAPRLGCFNLHGSLLPRWRGAAPIHRAILAGDAETGVCLMQMDAGLDTGPVLLRAATTIGAEDTTADLHDSLSQMGADLVVSALPRLPSLVPVPQPEEGVTYASKIDKSEARIDWHAPATVIDRQIRGLSPFPGAWCESADERVKFLRSRLAQGHGLPGQVLHGLTIACGSGAVEITLAQREGKRPATTEEFLRGFALPDRLT